VVPQGTTAPFTTLNGTATWNGSGSLASINASDRAIVSWNSGAFTIANGETFSFLGPSGGSILNKVGYTSTGALGTPDIATINGTLTSTGRVFVVANGSIVVGGGAVINTAGGLFLSTLQETDNFTFATSGNIAANGASTGSLTIGNSGTQVSVAGNLTAWGGTVSPNNLSVSGDLIINQKGAGTGLVLTGANGNTSVGGNLTVATTNGTITQSSTGLTVGNVTSLNTNGTAGALLWSISVENGGKGYTGVPPGVI
jgi:hypothetical protein